MHQTVVRDLADHLGLDGLCDVVFATVLDRQQQHVLAALAAGVDYGELPTFDQLNSQLLEELQAPLAAGPVTLEDVEAAELRAALGLTA